MRGEGRGCQPDLQASRARFLQAAELGNTDAEVAAGEMLINGRGGPPDTDMAMALFKRAAASGHPGALFALDALRAAPNCSPGDRPERGASADGTGPGVRHRTDRIARLAA